MALNDTMKAMVDEQTRNYSVPIATASILAVLSLLYWRSLNGLDPQEPPEIKSKIPFFGHLIGMLRYGLDYFRMLA
jgi:hypothetical protein